MSIAPSTDIVAEVARAADPARAAAVTAKLNALSNQGAGSPEDFAEALDSGEIRNNAFHGFELGQFPFKGPVDGQADTFAVTGRFARA